MALLLVKDVDNQIFLLNPDKFVSASYEQYKLDVEIGEGLRKRLYVRLAYDSGVVTCILPVTPIKFAKWIEECKNSKAYLLEGVE